MPGTVARPAPGRSVDAGQKPELRQEIPIPFDVLIMTLFGVLGYLFRKFGYEPAPLVLAFVLGPMLESHPRKALILAQGDLTTFITQPISATCLALAALCLLVALLPGLSAKCEVIARDQS
jgi:putative tricarboxylic transport membrane protein